LISSIRQIGAELESIERDDALYEEAGFGQRLEALEAIESCILERVDHLGVAHGETEALVVLKERAELLESRMEAVDERLFHTLREVIRSGTVRGLALRRQFEACAGCGRPNRVQNRDTYDSLDALVSGALFAGAAPGEPAPPGPEMVPYQPTPARIVFELVDMASFRAHDVLYDLGSGLGQVVILANLLSAVRAKGVEVDPAYWAYARRCAHGLGLSRVSFVLSDARQADYGDGTAFFLYTPFEGNMLQQVLDRLEGEAETRTIRVYTYGPCTYVVSRQDWLRPVGLEANHVDRLAAFRSVRGDS
jgi:hypothetical protein